MVERATHRTSGEVIEVDGSVRAEILRRGSKLDHWDVEREPEQFGPVPGVPVTRFDAEARPEDNVAGAMIQLRSGLPRDLTDQQRQEIEGCVRPLLLALAKLYLPPEPARPVRLLDSGTVC